MHTKPQPSWLPPGLPTTAWWTDPQTVSQTNLSSFMLSLSWQLDKRPLEHLEVFLWSLFSWLSLGQSIMATVDFHSVGFSNSTFLNRDASRQYSPGQILTTSQWWKSPPLPLPLHLRYLQSNLWRSHTWKKKDLFLGFFWCFFFFWFYKTGQKRKTHPRPRQSMESSAWSTFPPFSFG